MLNEPAPNEPVPSEPAPDDAGLDVVVRELEAHAAEQGWDRAAQLFALVSTADLVEAEPALAAELGLDADRSGLTPIDQELPADADLEDTLTRVTWPEEVAGCAAVVERLVLPPDAEAEIPEERAAASAYAAAHPDRQELRMVAAVLRDGRGWCAMRFRTHDDPAAVVTGPDLVPALLELLRGTLVPEVTPPDNQPDNPPDNQADPAVDHQEST